MDVAHVPGISVSVAAYICAAKTVKEIGAMATVPQSKADVILLVGGIAYSKPLTHRIKGPFRFMIPIYFYPGEDEALSIAQIAIPVPHGKGEIQVYK